MSATIKSTGRRSAIVSKTTMIGDIKAGVPTYVRKPRRKPTVIDPRIVGAPKEIVNGGFITLNDYFKVEEGVYRILERNIMKGTNTLLLGPTGVGKTELVSNIAKKLELPLTIFDMGTMTDPIMSLVGTHAIKVRDGHTTSEFIASRFSEIIKNPGIVLLDELSR